MNKPNVTITLELSVGEANAYAAWLQLESLTISDRKTPLKGCTMGQTWMIYNALTQTSVRLIEAVHADGVTMDRTGGIG